MAIREPSIHALVATLIFFALWSFSKTLKPAHSTLASSCFLETATMGRSSFYCTKGQFEKRATYRMVYVVLKPTRSTVKDAPHKFIIPVCP